MWCKCTNRYDQWYERGSTMSIRDRVGQSSMIKSTKPRVNNSKPRVNNSKPNRFR